MKSNKMSIDQNWKGMYKVGGFSLLIAGVIPILYLLFVIIMQQTIPPLPLETLENPGPPVTLFLIAIIGETLLMPGVLGLYFALKNTNKTHMLIATAFSLISVIMFLVSRAQIFSLFPISGRYMATPSEIMKAAYLASADRAIELGNIYADMALMFLGVASILIGLVMLKGAVGRRIGYLVIVAGIFTVFVPPAVILELPIMIPLMAVVLGAVWQLIVGARLYSLGKRA